jgi:hypothetical protein
MLHWRRGGKHQIDSAQRRAQSRCVEKSLVIQNRPIGLAELEQMGALLADHPDWSRYRLSRELIL